MTRLAPFCLLSVVLGGLSALALSRINSTGERSEIEVSAPGTTSARQAQGDPEDDFDSIPEFSPDRARRIDTFLEQAVDDPAAALNEALSLDDYWHRRLVLESIAANWVVRDPQSALAYLRGWRNARPPDRHAALKSAAFAWVSADTEGMLRYLQSASGRSLLFAECECGEEIVRLLARDRADALLAATTSMAPGRIRSLMLQAAVPWVAAEDLDYALRAADRLPPGADRRIWVDSIAPVFAALDPERALDWAERMEPTSPGIVARVDALGGP